MTMKDELQDEGEEKDPKKQEEVMYFQFELTALFVGTLLVEWDLTGNDGKPWPVDLESVGKLPQGILQRVMGAIYNDVSVKDTIKN